MARKQITTREKAFRELVRAEGCVITGEHAQIHHIQEYRREYFIIPLAQSLHKGSGYGFHDNKKRFRNTYGSEWELYFLLRKRMEAKGIWPSWVDQKIEEYYEGGTASHLFKQTYNINYI